MLPPHATITNIRHSLLQELRKAYPESESASLLQMILDHAGYPSPTFLVDPERVPGPETVAQINEIVSEIHTGKPIQYILGYAHFCDLKIRVTNKVLIPRPETEEMVTRIISSSGIPPAGILDIGTGSGCIALALKQRFSNSHVTGIDEDPEALEVASRNGRMHRLQITWRLHDILEPGGLGGGESYDLIVSNPPYVLESEKEIMDQHVLAFEPHSALFVYDPDPFLFVRAIGTCAAMHLHDGGSLWLEINERLGKESVSVLEGSGLGEVSLLKDIHGKDRFIHARK